MKARTFVLIYFKTVKATQGKKKKIKYRAIQSQHAAKENGFTAEEEKKSRLQKQTWQIHWEPVMQVILKHFFV